MSDVLLTVFTTALSVGVVVWISYLMLIDHFGGVRASIPWIVANGVLNSYVLGIPVMVLLHQWYTRIRRGEFLHTWLWRECWRWQALTLSPALLLMLLNGIGWLRDQYGM